MRQLLTELHDEFIKRANEPTVQGSLPVEPKEARVPILAVDRWRVSSGVLFKTYRFRRPEDKREFVTALLQYEVEVGHTAHIVIQDDSVEVSVTTKDLGKATEVDKEYAAYADTVFRDLVYNPRHDDDGDGQFAGPDERGLEGPAT